MKNNQPKQDGTTFEFVLTLENNIIVQRFFMVNGHNPKSHKSIDLYNCITDVCEDITKTLKIKNLEYMSDNYKCVTENESTEPIKEEYFKLEIKLDGTSIISRIFPAHVYHPKARYCDVRPKIRKYLGDFTDTLSERNLDKKYLNYELK